MAKKEILIVGNGDEVNYSFANILRFANYEPQIVASLFEAQQAAEREDPPTILIVAGHLSDEHLEFGRKYPGSKGRRIVALLTSDYSITPVDAKLYETYFRLGFMPIWREELLELIMPFARYNQGGHLENHKRDSTVREEVGRLRRQARRGSTQAHPRIQSSQRRAQEN